MAFTTDEILSYFTLTGPNPLKKRPANHDSLTSPGRGLIQRKKEEEERRRTEREYAFGGHREGHRRHDGGGGGRQKEPQLLAPPGLNQPVYNLERMEDIDVGEDYMAELSLRHSNDQAGFLSEDSANVASFYKRYSFDIDHSPHLPVTELREELVRTIESKQVTIIQGATGSGKSTLVPQYILQHYARRDRHCNIICTQPRRIATRTIAKYVAKCRGWNLGSIVGYQIYNEKETSEDTRLTFVTTGVLLEKLIGCANMNEYTHVILDEVM